MSGVPHTVPAAAALALDRLTAGYGETRIVEDVSFTVAAGTRLALLGRNGVGKTTLLAALMGLTRRHAGRIRIGDVDVSDMGSARRAQIGLGYVPQTRDIFRSLTVEENLLAGLKGRPRSAMSEAYDLFPRLAERRGNLGSELSGGEQQMLSTARSILGRPTVLLLDEPLEGLAPVICDELMRSLQQLAARREMTIVLVEQQIDRALDFADRVAIMERGRIVWSGTPGALNADPGAVERYIGVGIH
jgi:branched-chain amino acid transport system ATP-binding protein